MITELCTGSALCEPILSRTPQSLAEDILSRRKDTSCEFLHGNDLRNTLGNEITRSRLLKWFKRASAEVRGKTAFVAEVETVVETMRKASNENGGGAGGGGGGKGEGGTERVMTGRNVLPKKGEGGGFGGGRGFAITQDGQNFTSELEAAGLKAWAKMIMHGDIYHVSFRINSVIPEGWPKTIILFVCEHFLVSLEKVLPVVSMDEQRIKERQKAEDRKREILQEMVQKEAGRHATKRYKAMDFRKLGAFQSAYEMMEKGGVKKSKNIQVKELRASLEHGDILDALPIWIMPTDLVSKILPSKLGLFDLVILEEASQSDCQAIPVLLRGKKLIVVGDTQQLNPPNSIAEFKQMISDNLDDQLPKDTVQNLLPGKSIFELFEFVFKGPASTICLREHFRCCSCQIQRY